MVIDDELDVLDTIVENLEISLLNKNFKIFKYSSSASAINDFKKSNDFDLVISDLHMPELTGIDVSTEIRKIDLELPIFIFSGQGNKKEFEILSKIGIDIMIGKPNIKKLMRSVLKIF